MKKAKSLLPTEDQECYVFVDWLTRMRLRFCHIANESKIPVQYRMKLKRKGVSPGFPDYIIFIPKRRCKLGRSIAFFIEMKRIKGGVISPAQSDWLSFLNVHFGENTGVVCKGAHEAIKVVTKHLA